MKTAILVTFVSIFLIWSVPVFAEPVDAAKEAIEKIKKDKETDLKKREEQKAKADAAKSANKDNVPGKLVFRGKVDKVIFAASSRMAANGTVIIKLANGQTLSVPHSKIFIMGNQPTGIMNIMLGMNVAIVNPMPSITISADGNAPDAAAVEKLKSTCVISPTSKIYCGNDSDKLGQYYPAKK